MRNKKKQWIEKYRTKHQAEVEKPSRKLLHRYHHAVARPLISHLIREIEIKSRFIHVLSYFLFDCVSAWSSPLVSIRFVWFHFVVVSISILIKIRRFYWKGYSFCLGKHFSVCPSAPGGRVFQSNSCEPWMNRPSNVQIFFILNAMNMFVYASRIAINLCHSSSLAVITLTAMHSLHSNWIWWRWINIWAIARLLCNSRRPLFRLMSLVLPEPAHLFP